MSTVSIGSVRSRSRNSGQSSGVAWRWGGVVAILVLLAFMVAWLFGWIRFTTDPRVLEILAMQEEARQKFVANGGPQTLVEAAEAVASMGAIREKMDNLPKHLRGQVDLGSSRTMRSTFRDRIDAYFAAPPEKRLAELDRQIKQEELMRKAFEAASTVSGMFGGGGRDGGGTGSGNAGGPPSGGGRSRTEEERNAWRKQMIDRTTPEQRARYVEYRRAMDIRREQLGLPPRGPR